jgi:gliding motility-associated lipoprotein GldH
MPRNFILLMILFLSIISSCEDSKLQMEYKNFNDRWSSKEKAVFKINPISKQEVNLVIYIRNDYRYPFSNLFLIASLKEDNNILTRDTLEFEMADTKGNWLGSGFMELKESKLWWKENFEIPDVKKLTAEIEHAVRFNGDEIEIDGLEGIVGVGLALEAISK